MILEDTCLVCVLNLGLSSSSGKKGFLGHHIDFQLPASLLGMLGKAYRKTYL